VFIPYTGGRPVAKGWNNKRGRAERGRFDTLVVDRDGRACGLSTGEPSRHGSQPATATSNDCKNRDEIRPARQGITAAHARVMNGTAGDLRLGDRPTRATRQTQ